MIELLVIVVAFIILVLVVIWTHFITQNRQQVLIDNSFRDQTNVSLYHEHKAEIEKDFQQGNIDEESQQYLLSELEQTLLQDIEENEEQANQEQVKGKSLAVIWPILLSVFILCFSGVYYNYHGSFDLIVNTPKSSGTNQEVDAQQQAMMQVKALKEVVEQEPENSDAWYRLGQELVGLGQFEHAITAFDQVITIDGEKADLYGAKAQAAYYLHDQKIAPIVQEYIDKALSLDAKDPSTNILLGMHSFITNKFEQAITYWQIVIDDGRSTVNTEAIQSAIVEAKSRLAIINNQTAAAESTVQLSLSVSVSDEIFEQLSQGEDKVVFIYATPIEGGRMPLAAMKVSASDLPLDVVLTDASAMTPQAKLSDVEKVNLYAIISSTGGVGIKDGDFKAELRNVAVNETKTLSLIIDHVVKSSK